MEIASDDDYRGIGATVPAGNTCLTLTPITLLNDTGITTCSDGSSNGLSCPVDGYPGQDAQYGRDVSHNDDSDGHAGFSFTKIGSNGEALPASATDWSCVRDNVTGLLWEVKTDLPADTSFLS